MEFAGCGIFFLVIAYKMAIQGIAGTNQQSSKHVIDYTFQDRGTEDSAQVFSNVQKVLQEHGLNNQFSQLFEMRVGHIRTEEDYATAFQMDAVLEELETFPVSEDRDILINNLSYATYPHLICLSDYNQLLETAGEPLLALEQGEAAVYMDSDFTSNERSAMLNTILNKHVKAKLSGHELTLTGNVQTVNLITDRALTLSFALILPDEAITQMLYYARLKSSTKDYRLEDVLTISIIHAEQEDVISVEDNGMGLYLTKKMAADLNLRLEAFSRWGEGFCIEISFPK